MTRRAATPTASFIAKCQILGRDSARAERLIDRLAEQYGFERPRDVLSVQLDTNQTHFRVLSRDVFGKTWAEDDGRPAEHVVTHRRRQ